MDETQEQYLARKAAEQKAVWIAEHKAIEDKRKADALKAIEDAKSTKELDARLARLAFEHEHQYMSPQAQVTCSVCGSMVREDAICHVVNGHDLCIRKTREAKLCGRINKEQWDDLTVEEKRDGFVIKGIIFSTDDGSTGTFSPAGKANLLAGLVTDDHARTVK